MDKKDTIDVYAVRIDVSDMYSECNEGRSVLDVWGKVYDVYLFSPQCSKVYIASSQPSAEMEYVDVVPGKSNEEASKVLVRLGELDEDDGYLEESAWEWFEEHVQDPAMQEQPGIEYFDWYQILKLVEEGGEDVAHVGSFPADEYSCQEAMEEAVEWYQRNPDF